MSSAHRPMDEAWRLQALYNLDVLDSAPEHEFDALVRSAASLCDAPISMISLVDSDRIWFKAAHGLDDLKQSPRALWLCNHAINSDGVFEINDTLSDVRYKDNPLVNSTPFIRYYAAAPLRLVDGATIGTLCVIDHKPRQLLAKQRNALLDLASVTIRLLEDRQARLLQSKLNQNLANEQRQVAYQDARFQALSEFSPLGIFSCDNEGSVTYANRAYVDILGIPREEALGLAWLSMLDSEDQQRVMKVRDFCLAENMDFDVAFKLHRPDGEVRTIRSRARALYDLKSRSLGSTGIWEDITERELILTELTNSRERQRFLYEKTPAALYTSDSTGRILEVSERCITLLGYGREQMVGRLISDFLEPKTKIRAQQELAPKMAIMGSLDSEPLKFISADGRVIETLLSLVSECITDGDGTIHIGIIQDVSPLRRAEQALSYERNRLSDIFEANQIGAWEWNYQTGELRLNSLWASILGATLDDFQPPQIDNLTHLIHPKDVDKLVLWEDLPADQDSQFIEFYMRLRHKNGYWVALLSRGRVTSRSRNGEIEWICGTSMDATAAQRQKEELRKSQQFLSRVGKIAGIGGWELDIENELINFTEEAANIFGLSGSCQLTFDENEQFYEESARGPLRKLYRDVKSRKISTWDVETIIVRRDGHQIWVRSVAYAEFQDGQLIRLTGALQDISAQVQQRLELEEASNRMTLATDVGQIGIWEYDVNSGLLTMDKWARRIHGMGDSSTQAIDHAIHRFLHPEDIKRGQAKLAEMLESAEPIDIEYRIIWPDGSFHHVHNLARSIRDNEGNVMGVIGALWDITDQKEQESELRKSQSFLYRTGHMAKVGGWEYDPSTEITRLTDEACHIYQLEPGFRGSVQEALRFYCPEDQRLIRNYVLEAERTKTPWEVEALVTRQDGSQVWCRIMGAVEYENDVLLRHVGALQDVTTQRQQAAAMTHTLALQNAIFASADVSIISTDNNGIITSFNRAAEQLLGYSAAEMIGLQSPVLIHDPDEIQTRAEELSVELDRSVEPGFEVFIAVARQRGAEQHEWTYLRRDGGRFPVLLSVTALGDNPADPVGYVGIAVDITERRRNEQRIASALKEKETLLQEVYHRVKNNLQVITSLLNLQRRSLPEGVVTTALTETAERIRVMAMVHEKLYMSGNLSSIRMDTYVKDLCQGLLNAYVVKAGDITLSCDVAPLELTLDQAIPLGLFLNEVVTNSLKHGFPDSRMGTIRVNIHQVQENVVVSVQDDGVGFPHDFDLNQSTSLGLKLILTLSRQLGGQLNLDDNVVSGTALHLEFPLVNMNRHSPERTPLTGGPVA